MSSQPIVLSDANMLAEFMRQAEFKAFFEKTVEKDIPRKTREEVLRQISELGG